MPMPKEGDRVIIHQTNLNPLPERLKNLYAQVGTVVLILPDNIGYIIELDESNEMVHIPSENVIVYKEAKIDKVFVLEAFDEDLNSLKVFRYYENYPTDRQIYRFKQGTGASFVEVRTLYK